MSNRKAPELSPKKIKINTKKKGLDGEIWIVYKRSDNIKSWKRYKSKLKKENIKKGGLLSRFIYYDLNKLSDNLFFYIGHGLENKKLKNIKLKKNQKIIVECFENWHLVVPQGRDWNIAYSSRSSQDYYNNLKKDNMISSNLCIYENDVPNLQLFSRSGPTDSNIYRWGLYNFPVDYDVNILKKNEDIRDNYPELSEDLLDQNEIDLDDDELNFGELSLSDLSRDRSYVTINSMAEFTHNNAKKPLFLADLITKIEETNKEFTLVLYVCRSYSNNNIKLVYNDKINGLPIKKNVKNITGMSIPQRNLKKLRGTNQIQINDYGNFDGLEYI